MNTLRSHFKLEILGDPDEPDRCVLHNFVDGLLDETWRITSGQPIAQLWPEHAVIKMTDEDRSPKLASFLSNVSDMLLVSLPFRHLIARHCVGVPIEYLPLIVMDPRGRPLSESHFLINPLGTFDCMNYDRSQLRRSRTNQSRITHVETLVLSPEKMVAAPQLFRPKDSEQDYVFGENLVQDIRAANLTNVVFTQLAYSN